jgi:hypothetical protein
MQDVFQWDIDVQGKDYVKMVGHHNVAVPGDAPLGFQPMNCLDLMCGGFRSSQQRPSKERLGGYEVANARFGNSSDSKTVGAEGRHGTPEIVGTGCPDFAGRHYPGEGGITAINFYLEVEADRGCHDFAAGERLKARSRDKPLPREGGNGSMGEDRTTAIASSLEMEAERGCRSGGSGLSRLRWGALSRRRLDNRD